MSDSNDDTDTNDRDQQSLVENRISRPPNGRGSKMEDLLDGLETCTMISSQQLRGSYR
jgi:hypothetical protein